MTGPLFEEATRVRCWTVFRDGVRSLVSWLFFPIYLVQGLWLRLTVPRLPEGAGPRVGEVSGGSPALRLLVIGESPAAGVGVAEQGDGLAAQAARRLAEVSGCALTWRLLARNGVTAREARERLLGPAEGIEADAVILVFGVNDTLRYHGPRRWRRDLGDLIEAVRRRCGIVPVVVAEVPPMDRFPALPAPTRQLLGWRSRRLSQAAAELAGQMDGVTYREVPETIRARMEELFSEDGFHPSREGHRLFGELLGEATAEMLEGEGRQEF